MEEALNAASTDYQELLRLTEERQREEQILEDLMTRWEEAAGALEGK